jgi:hypothetical protein
VDRHRQLEALALVLLAPADISQQAEVFGELQAQLLGFGEVLSSLQGDPEVLDAAEVVADQFVEPFALVAGDGRGDGHGAPPLG